MLITGTPPQITLAGDETLKVKQDNNTEEITVDHLAAYIGGGGGGATDHGALTGLSDDDHPQYLTSAEAGLLYAAESHTHDAGDITNLSEVIMDRVNTLLVAGTGISLVYDDFGDYLTIEATGGGGAGVSLPVAMAISSLRI